MRTPFEPTKSFCYRVARYELLDQIAQEPEALTGQPFRMNTVTRRVIERNLTPEQLAIEIPAANADRIDTVIPPFCKGARSRAFKRPWPTAVLV